MRNNYLMVLTGAAALMLAPAVRADVWDVQSQNDNTSASESTLVHGSDQLHDLANITTGTLPQGCAGAPCADQDWYRVRVPAASSFEVVVDSASQDVMYYGYGHVSYGGITVRQVDATGALVKEGDGVGFYGYLGLGRSLTMENTNPAAAVENFVRVTPSPVGGCGTVPNCGTNDVYMIRGYETTYSIPRFNNSSSQVTVLLLQNPNDHQISGNIWFWSAAGAPLGTPQAFTLNPYAILVLNTSTLPFANGVGGSITVSHNGEYGSLGGKAVAVEPATGFTFDTPMVWKPI